MKWRQSRNLTYNSTVFYSWIEVTSVNFNTKKVHLNDIFGQQDILQIFSGDSKNDKYEKSQSPR